MRPRRIVVEGCGDWSVPYFEALKKLQRPDVGVFFTYDSTYGNAQSRRETLKRVRRIEKESPFDFIDLRGRGDVSRQEALPRNVDVVFVVTPDRTHCSVAEYWLGKARTIFVEKPFDASSQRITTFLEQSPMGTAVHAIDHYYLRCDHVAAGYADYLGRVLKRVGRDLVTGQIASFEFRMTEPPTWKGGRYDRTTLEARAPSLDRGLVFDMAPHSLPLLLPFFEPRHFQVKDVWAGVSAGLRDLFPCGVETFSLATVEAKARPELGGYAVPGRIAVGKDVGDRQDKWLTLTGPGGTLVFDLADYRIYHRARNGHLRPVAPLYHTWAQFFLKEVLDGRIPAATFPPKYAHGVVRFLEQWRNRSQAGAPVQRPLHEYPPGAKLSDLTRDRYRCLT